MGKPHTGKWAKKRIGKGNIRAESHGKIRKSCYECPGSHPKNDHRSHGRGAFYRTHCSNPRSLTFKRFCASDINKKKK